METSCEECLICTESTPITDFNTLPCNHKLCKECFPKIKTPMCPFCRSPYGEIDTEVFQNDFDIPFFVDFEVEVELVRFLTPRQRRRQTQRRRRSMNRRRVPIRRVNHTVPTQILDATNLNITDPQSPPPPIKTKYSKKRNKNEKKRIITANNYNYLRNQQNIY
jgi:hypothetical protein